MAETYPTTDFFIIQAEPTDRLEIWIDWVPAIDGDPALAVRAWREGQDLCIQTLDDGERAVRIFALNEQAWNGLSRSGGQVVVCGPSGVLGRRNFRLA